MKNSPNGCRIPPPTLGPRRSLRSLACDVFDRILMGERPIGAIDHPLDFVCIPIVRTPRSGVCGHIWSNTGGATTIHSHSWHLYSEVVLGAIANEVFQVTEQPNGGHQIVQIHSAGLTDQMTPTGISARVTSKTTEVYNAGDSYTLSASAFHRSTPVTASPTLTLMRATMLAGQYDQILVNPPLPEGSAQRKLLPEKKARPLVILFRNAIET